MSENPVVSAERRAASDPLPAFPGHEFWTEDRVARFCRDAVPQEFRVGAFILSPDDPPQACFLLESGTVSMYYYSSEGNVITHARYGPGELLGVKGLFITPTRLFHTVADGRVRVWKLPYEKFRNLLREDFDFVEWHFRRVFSRLDNLERKNLNSALLSAHCRIALTLLELSEHTENRKDNTADVAITQQELSNMLSITRQTTGVCLKNLQSKGILATKRGKIEIRDLAALRQETV